MAQLRLFKRRSDQFWWHWRPDCLLWQSVPMWKLKGKIIIYTTVTGRPSNFILCPGCHAIDNRVRTRDYGYRPSTSQAFVSAPSEWSWVQGLRF